MTHRLANLRSSAAGMGLDGVLISNPHNRRYIAGFTGTACNLLVTPKHQILATDPRYTEQAAGESPGWDVRDISQTPGWLAQFVRELGIRQLGFEADHLTVAQHGRLRNQLREADCEMVETSELVANMRITKDQQEVASLEKAISIGDEALMEATRGMQPGVTERQLAINYLTAARRLGASNISFDTIVASGPNAARPHHQPTDRQIQEGEPIVFDCGVIYEGYCSDLTRTLVLGEPPPKVREIYNIVLEAQTKGIEAVKPGIKGKDADAAARQVIERAGYGPQFGHGLGHGVGLEIHEQPYLSRGGELTLQPGAAVTVEPGIYIPGWGGVRIEDVVLVEETGARLLSKAPKMNL